TIRWPAPWDTSRCGFPGPHHITSIFLPKPIRYAVWGTAGPLSWIFTPTRSPSPRCCCHRATKCSPILSDNVGLDAAPEEGDMSQPWTFRQLYQHLDSTLEPGIWWPAESVFEVGVGAILAQNTTWVNVEMA